MGQNDQPRGCVYVSLSARVFVYANAGQPRGSQTKRRPPARRSLDSILVTSHSSNLLGTKESFTMADTEGHIGTLLANLQSMRHLTTLEMRLLQIQDEYQLLREFATAHSNNAPQHDMHELIDHLKDQLVLNRVPIPDTLSLGAFADLLATLLFPWPRPSHPRQSLTMPTSRIYLYRLSTSSFWLRTPHETVRRSCFPSHTPQCRFCNQIV